MAEKDVSIYKSGLPVNPDDPEQTTITPFDDRRNLKGRIDDISPGLVKQFLKDIRSHRHPRRPGKKNSRGET